MTEFVPAPPDTWAVVDLLHKDCAECLAQGAPAVVRAKVLGSTEGTHAATTIGDALHLAAVARVYGVQPQFHATAAG